MIDKEKAIEAQQCAIDLVPHHRHGIRLKCEHLLTADQLRELIEDRERIEKCALLAERWTLDDWRKYVDDLHAKT